MPCNKTEEWMKCMSDMASNPLPSCIKKWQTFTSSDGDGYMGYNLIFTEKGKGDKGFIEIAKLIFPFLKIEGSSWKLEPLMGVTDSFELLKE
jgi:hypothetical protein